MKTIICFEQQIWTFEIDVVRVFWASVNGKKKIRLEFSRFGIQLQTTRSLMSLYKDQKDFFKQTVIGKRPIWLHSLIVIKNGTCSAIIIIGLYRCISIGFFVLAIPGSRWILPTKCEAESLHNSSLQSRAVNGS